MILKISSVNIGGWSRGNGVDYAHARLCWTGRYVRVQLTEANYFGLSEVQVIEAGGGSAVQWLVADQLGTPRMVVDKTGSLSAVKRHDYLPFGEELYAGVGGRTTQQGYSSDSVRQKFTAYEHDAETGLEFAHARYYSSSCGRFTSPDPFSGSMGVTDPQRDIQKMEVGLMFSSRRGDVVISFCIEVTIG